MTGPPAPVPPHRDPDTRIGDRDLTRWARPMRPAVRAAGAVASRLGPYGAFALPLVLGVAILGAGSWAFGEVYEDVADAGGVARLDRPVLLLAKSVRTPVLDRAVTAFTDLGGGVIAPLIVVVVIAVLVVRRRSWTPLLVIGSATLGSLLLTIAGKPVFGRSRPPHADAVPPFETSPSFPSGHTLNATVIAGSIAYVLLLREHSAARRALTVLLAALWALSIGLSRVFLGLHWFTDVLAGWVLGVAWLAVVITVHRLFLTVRRSRDGPARSA